MHHIAPSLAPIHRPKCAPSRRCGDWVWTLGRLRFQAVAMGAMLFEGSLELLEQLLGHVRVAADLAEMGEELALAGDVALALGDVPPHHFQIAFDDSHTPPHSLAQRALATLIRSYISRASGAMAFAMAGVRRLNRRCPRARSAGPQACRPAACGG